MKSNIVIIYSQLHGNLYGIKVSPQWLRKRLIIKQSLEKLSKLWMKNMHLLNDG